MSTTASSVRGGQFFLAPEWAYMLNPTAEHEENLGLPYWFKASDDAIPDDNGDVLIPVAFENEPRRADWQAGYVRIPRCVRSVKVPTD